MLLITRPKLLPKRIFDAAVNWKRLKWSQQENDVISTDNLILEKYQL